MPKQPEDFAATLASLREAKGWSKYRLAKLSGVSAQHLLRLERGDQQPSLEVARKLAAALGCDLNAFA